MLVSEYTMKEQSISFFSCLVLGAWIGMGGSSFFLFLLFLLLTDLLFYFLPSLPPLC